MKYELKPMSLGEILDNGFKVFSNNVIPLLLISLIIQVPIYLLSTAAGFVMGDTSPDDPLVLGGYVVAMIGAFLIQPIGTAASTKLIADRYLGNPSTVGSSFAYAGKIFIPLIGALILSTLATLLGYVVLIIPGLILTVRLTLVAQSCVLEGKGGSTALSRSMTLTKGSFGKFVGLIFVLGALGLVAGMASVAIWGQGTMISSITQIGLQIILGAYGFAIWVVAYFDRRCDLEAFDLELLAESLAD